MKEKEHIVKHIQGTHNKKGRNQWTTEYIMIITYIDDRINISISRACIEIYHRILQC